MLIKKRINFLCFFDFKQIFLKPCFKGPFGLSNILHYSASFKPPVVYSTDRSKAVVPVLVLLFVALWFILRGDLLYVFPCVILFLRFFSPFSIAITSLGEEGANLSAFRTFVRFVLV